jgi:4-amino-4-deoxy-L-arabinose transferase-like glycosyltransferase
LRADRPPTAWARFAPWALLGLVALLFVVDFAHDVHGRDAFSWMDPYQYYYFAADLVQGHRAFNQFEIPSIFPFAIAPFLLGGVSVPAGLWVNVFFLLVLCLAIHRLSRQLAIAVPSALVCAAVLASPLLIGLSRELYIEFALTAVCALVFAQWIDARRPTGLRHQALFGALFGLGVLLKTTFPLFFVAPFLVIALPLARSRQYARLGRELAAFVVPWVVVVGLTYLVFTRSFTYYLSLGNTSIPIMKLIGPQGASAASSLFYYISVLWRTVLFLLAPPLVLALVWPGSRRALLDRKAALLWAWLVGPLVLFSLEAVKEPRHIAPCVVPAVLLLFRGVSALKPGGARRAACAGVLAISLGQYLLVTHHALATPYFLDRPSRVEEILRTMQRADAGKDRYRDGNGQFNELWWLYTKNVALRGFEPNMALLLAWRFHPAVVYDLDLLREDGGRSRANRDARFEDLYFLTAFDLYNRRCLWRTYYRTLDADTVVSNADYVLVCGTRDDARDLQTRQYRSTGVVGTGSSRVQVWVTETPRTRSYRTIYARGFLRSGRTLAPEDRAAVYFDLAMNAILRRDLPEVDRILAEHPLEPGRRNIYWTGSDKMLEQTAAAGLKSYIAQRRPPPGPGA